MFVLSTMVALQIWSSRRIESLTTHAHDRLADQGGQTSAEYALVLLAAGAVALLVATWAKSSGKVGALLDAIFDGLVSSVT